MNASKLAIARNVLKTQRALSFSKRLRNEDFESMMNNVVTGRMAKVKMVRFYLILLHFIPSSCFLKQKMNLDRQKRLLFKNPSVRNASNLKE